ncbi:MAG: tetratricopeptide repeat protein, partial [Bacteroidaceae bacterium]|nr:tetratricopeptide repeat protein [Bacteroidaceae bacterium]
FLQDSNYMTKMRILNFYLSILFLSFSSLVCAQQTDRDCIRQGNKYFHEGEMDKAVTYYQKALEKKRSVEAFYNMGCAYIMMQQDSMSIASFMEADTIGFTNAKKRAMNFHNMGNIWYMSGLSRLRSNDQNTYKYFANAVNLYKSALRCNPDDNQTRYNLAMAMWMLKNTNGGGNGQDNKEQEQQKKEEEQKQQEEQQKQEQKKQDQQQKDKEEMSDEVAEQLLKSAQQDEKDVQKKVNAMPQRRRSLEKDW